MKDIEVPCNGCTLCCHSGNVRLLPEDNPERFKHEASKHRANTLIISKKPNGECWYLSSEGCTIYEDRPMICRSMDCRNIYKAIPTYTKARKQGNTALQIWKKGKELIASDGL